MAPRIRIAYLHPSSGLWGSERSLLSLLHDLDRKTFEPLVILTSAGPLGAAVTSESIDYRVLPWLEDAYLRRSGRRVLAVLRLAAWLRHHHIDILHLSLWEGIEGVVSWFAARLSGVRIVVGIRLQLDYVSPSDRLWLSRASCLVSVSREAVAPVLSKRRFDWFWRVDPRQIVIIPPGRDLKALDRGPEVPASDLDALGMCQGVEVVGMVGAIDWMKGSDIFVNAAALLARARPDLRFVMVGAAYNPSSLPQARYAESIRDLVQALGLSERLIITGYRADAVRLMKHLAVIVLPSRREAASGTLIEAMALGVPVVASQAGGIPEIVRDGETGVLVKSFDPKEYAGAILDILGDRDHTRRMVETGRAWVQTFDSQHVTGKLEECYREVMAGR